MKHHECRIEGYVHAPEAGLLLGNGDLSVSVYQKPDRIIWRLGKPDLWDRRLDFSDSPQPMHIDELARGIRDEGWKYNPDIRAVETTRQPSNDPKRMAEITQYNSPAYGQRPYPCPKPAGELSVQLPPDLKGLRISQVLFIEQARIEIECRWDNGLKVDFSCFIPPEPNALVIDWKVSDWTDENAIGWHSPVWFSLYRWPDPTLAEYVAKNYAPWRMPYYVKALNPKATPLPPPELIDSDGAYSIQQTCYPDTLFPDGFRCRLEPFLPFTGGCPVEMSPMKIPGFAEARIDMVPASFPDNGSVIVGVSTSSDPAGIEQTLLHMRESLDSDPNGTLETWRKRNTEEAEKFWNLSSVSINDEFYENLWYNMHHARRCTIRHDVLPPGLSFPSTVRDYSIWHGDYHTDYNLEQAYWGNYVANHVSQGDAYFGAMKFIIDIGRKIAKDYWNCRGTFVQMSGYPVIAEDDPYGVGFFSRMAYMTGWAMNQYWWRYLYTGDEDWLRDHGYPALRDAALFYTDFLKKGSDGIYHAFPSDQSENLFSGDVRDFTDRPQVIRHARFCLKIASRAADILSIDPDLKAEWDERLANMPEVDDLDALGFTDDEKRRYELNAPEFIGMANSPIPRPGEYREDFDQRSKNHQWHVSPASIPWQVLTLLRNRAFDLDRDLPKLRQLLERWLLPNGTIRNSCVAHFGNMGAYVENTATAAYLQEMMLQSWDGAIRLFPCWPDRIDADFKTFRTEGAFLVSAGIKSGRVEGVKIYSEKGAMCYVAPPWPVPIGVTDNDGAPVATNQDANGFLVFATEAGRSYDVSEG